MTTREDVPQNVPVASAVWKTPAEVYAWLDDTLHQHRPPHVVVSSKFPTVAERVADHLRRDPSWTVETSDMFPQMVARRNLPDDALCLLVTSNAPHVEVLPAVDLFPFHLELFRLDTFRNSKRASYADMGSALIESVAVETLVVSEGDTVTALFGR